MQECCNKRNHFINKKWNNEDDANDEYLEDNFMEQLDYKLYTKHLEEMF